LRFEFKTKAGSGNERILMKKVLLIAVALTLVVGATAIAGNNPDAKVAIHVIPAPLRPGCAKHGLDLENATCADLITTEAGNAINAFPVFFDLTEYLGCEYGICWPGWYYSAAFTSCSYFVIGGIVNPGDGASHTWLNCYTGMCVPSYLDFYLIPGVDTGGMICPCPAPNGQLKVLDCAEAVDDPVCIFCAGVYGAIGDDPCEPTGTETSTWSEIKGMFE
jgi:hypothetical protein